MVDCNLRMFQEWRKQRNGGETEQVLMMNVEFKRLTADLLHDAEESLDTRLVLLSRVRPRFLSIVQVFLKCLGRDWVNSGWARQVLESLEI
ncbi:hypothetical protein Bca4012_035344 [Brassica carinata]|uniref:Uncharacterized protein n=1 Tax=Brassica carinata TaxID=52824 RepID=A0A8X8B9I9_BRACI|nr:hypothetical protein Bca52824_009106 [Brassica carinata]